MIPHINRLDDGSILIEWIDTNVRFGISIERDIKESGWFFVCPILNIMECGYFPFREMTNEEFEEYDDFLNKYFDN